MNLVNELTNEISGAAIEVHRTLHKWASGASSMSFQHNLCDLRVLGGEYATAIRARRTSPPTIPGSFGMAGPWNRDRPTGPPQSRRAWLLSPPALACMATPAAGIHSRCSWR